MEQELVIEPEQEIVIIDQQPETNKTEEITFLKTNTVIISEFMPNPEGDDSENEWVELYNAGDKTIDISNWFLDNREGGVKPFQFPYGTTIMPGEYRLFNSKITVKYLI